MFEEVRNFLAEYAEVNADEVEQDTPLSDLGIDSMKIFEMIARFENKFKVKVSDKQIGELFTVQDLVHIAERKAGNR